MDSGNIERRLAVIVSADVYGYSRLMAEDATVRMVTASGTDVSSTSAHFTNLSRNTPASRWSGPPRMGLGLNRK